jgi:cystathionine beta-synthase
VDVLSSMITKSNKPILVRDEQERPHIITRHDILKIMLN